MARPTRSPVKGSKPPAGRTIGLILLACGVAIALAAILSATGGVADDDVADVHDAGTISEDGLQPLARGRRVAAAARSEEEARPAQARHQAVRRGQAAGDAVPRVGQVDRRRGEGARHQREPRRGRPPVRTDQEAVVPQREGLPALPEDLRADREGPQVQGPPRRAVQQDPHAGHGEQPGRLRQRGREVLQPELAAVLAARAARHRGHPQQEAGRGARSQAARRERRAVVEGREGGLRPTQPPRSRAASCWASPRASRTRRSTPRSSPRSQSKIVGPIKTDAGLRTSSG